MGNQITRTGNGSHKKVESATAGTGNATHSTNVAAPKSEPDHAGSHMQFLPIESLAKVKFDVLLGLFHCLPMSKSSFNTWNILWKRYYYKYSDIDTIVKYCATGTPTAVEKIAKQMFILSSFSKNLFFTSMCYSCLILTAEEFFKLLLWYTTFFLYWNLNKNLEANYVAWFNF